MFPGGTAHGLQHGWSGLQVWVTLPLPTCTLVVRGGGGLLDTEVLHCPSVSPSAATAGCGWEGEGVRTPLVGLRTICAWDWGSYLLGAWTSGPKCVSC